MQLVLPLPQGLRDLFAGEEPVDLTITVENPPKGGSGSTIRKISGSFLLKGEIGIEDSYHGVSGILEAEELVIDDTVIPKATEPLFPYADNPEAHWWEIVRHPLTGTLPSLVRSGTHLTRTDLKEEVAKVEEQHTREGRLKVSRVELICDGDVIEAKDFV